MVLQARNTNEALNIIAEEVVDAIIIDTNYIDEPCMNLLTLLKQDMNQLISLQVDLQGEK